MSKNIAEATARRAERYFLLARNLPGDDVRLTRKPADTAPAAFSILGDGDKPLIAARLGANAIAR